MNPPRKSHSAPPSAPPWRLKASRSLSNLPLEIKTMILDEIAERDTTRNGRIQPIRPMRAMSLVSREFAALAEPYLWGHVDLYGIPSEDLSYILASVLPHHALRIVCLDLPQFHYYVESSSSTSDSEFDEWEGSQGPDYSVMATKLALLLTSAIRGMRNLSAVRSVLCQLSDPFNNRLLYDEEERRWTGQDMPPHARASSVAGAIAAIGPRLRELKLRQNDWDDNSGEFDHTEGRLAAFLANFTSLQRLSLDLYIQQDGRDRLISTLISFRHLKTLELTEFTLSDDAAFASAAWECPLETLSLKDSFFSISCLSNLLPNFSNTLQKLTLSDTPSEHPPGWDRHTLPSRELPLSLPHLQTLNLYLQSLRASLLLGAFASCPLRYLTLRTTPSIDPTQWQELVHSHLKTLRRVTIQVRATMKSQAVGFDVVRELCRAKGVECVVDQMGYL